MTPKFGFNKRLYWPVCRAYARHILGDKPADRVYRTLCTLQFVRSHRFWPDFVHPRRFSEKLWSRMFYERDPLLTVLSDKLGVRDYVEAKVGPDYLVPLLWSGENPDAIPYDELPASFVIKATHGCSYNIIVKDKSQLDREKTRRQLLHWLDQNYCQDYRLGAEWGYKNIRPSILVEAFIEDDGKVPIDYKFWCFAARVECATVHMDRFEKHRVRTMDRNFNSYAYPFPLDDGSGDCRRPVNFERMLKVAETLAEGFEFMRVDLYNLQGRIYFGEMTAYPAGIHPLQLATEQDYALGRKWRHAGKPLQSGQAAARALYHPGVR